jgi:hypothetical protein
MQDRSLVRCYSQLRPLLWQVCCPKSLSEGVTHLLWASESASVTVLSLSHGPYFKLLGIKTLMKTKKAKLTYGTTRNVESIHQNNNFIGLVSSDSPFDQGITLWELTQTWNRVSRQAYKARSRARAPPEPHVEEILHMCTCDRWRATLPQRSLIKQYIDASWYLDMARGPSFSLHFPRLHTCIASGSCHERIATDLTVRKATCGLHRY